MAEIRFCISCGAPLTPGAPTCAACGAPAPTAFAPAAPEPVQTRFAKGDVPPPEELFSEKEDDTDRGTDSGKAYGALMAETFAPMGAWNICGALLLMALPFPIGFVFAVVFACGGCRKKQKRKLAQGVLLFSLIASLLMLALVAWLVLLALPSLLSLLPPNLHTALLELCPFLATGIL